jgi:hypothetical protein
MKYVIESHGFRNGIVIRMNLPIGVSGFERNKRSITYSQDNDPLRFPGPTYTISDWRLEPWWQRKPTSADLTSGGG